MKAVCFSVTPSPYQRDLFLALKEQGGCELEVCYLEQRPDDSPWDCADLEPWESVLPGRVFGRGRVRCHWNYPLPALSGFDRVIVNAPLTGLTTQRLFRVLGRKVSPPWAFWGEQLLGRLGLRGGIQTRLAAPLANAGAIVAIGRTAAADYRRRFPKVEIHDVPYACRLVEFSAAAALRSSSRCCRFLFAGQMIPRKGVDILLESFSHLVGEGHAVELHLAGREGQLPEWLDALDPACRKQIIYHGFVQPPELPALFAMADVFVLPSRHDGWGVVVNQALGAGMPVIASTAAGAGRDLIDPGESGLLVPPCDTTALTAAMRGLAQDQRLRVRMAAAALGKAASIAPDAAANRWVSILKGL